MQNELRSEYPDAPIQIVGVNAFGQESGNAGMTEDRTAPLLQDVDVNNNGSSDVSHELWDVRYRDVKILNKQNEEVGTVNLTLPSGYDLGEEINYDALKQILTDVAHDRPFWQNADDPTDVNNDEKTSALDALICINELIDNKVSDGEANLPLPMPPMMPKPYLDVNGDGFITANDPLRIINQLIALSSSAEGESIETQRNSLAVEEGSTAEGELLLAVADAKQLNLTARPATPHTFATASDLLDERAQVDLRVDADGSPVESIWESTSQPASAHDADSSTLSGEDVDSVFRSDDDTLLADAITSSLLDHQPAN